MTPNLGSIPKVPIQPAHQFLLSTPDRTGGSLDNFGDKWKPKTNDPEADELLRTAGRPDPQRVPELAGVRGNRLTPGVSPHPLRPRDWPRSERRARSLLDELSHQLLITPRCHGSISMPSPGTPASGPAGSGFHGPPGRSGERRSLTTNADREIGVPQRLRIGGSGWMRPLAEAICRTDCPTDRIRAVDQFALCTTMLPPWMIVASVGSGSSSDPAWLS
jgi:hypothetical protein